MPFKSDNHKLPALHPVLPTTSKHLTILPEIGFSPNDAPSHDKYTYLAKLDFTKFPKITTTGSPLVSIPSCILKWIATTCILSSMFELLPYDEDNDSTKGHPITHGDQLPTNDTQAYTTYYHNHRITPGKQLTSMVWFSTSLLWGKIKEQNKSYFNWLQTEGIYLT